MPRPDSAESSRAIWGVLAAHLENAPGDSLRPLLTAGTTIGLLGLLAGTSSGRAARGSVFPRKVTCHPATPDSYPRGRRSYRGGFSALGFAGSLLLSRSASACCAFLKASYSGVPGLGGTPFGVPPNHSGA